jgi:hypothetical protein
MIALHKPKIYSNELASNSAVFGMPEHELEGDSRHEIPSIIYQMHDIKSSTIFVTIGETPEMSFSIRKAINKIKSYSDLENNWDGYGAVKPADLTINNAINFLRKADEDGLEVYFVAPGPNGEIVIEFKRGNLEAEVYFDEDDAGQVLIYNGDNCVVEGAIKDHYEDLREMFTSHEEV